MPSLPLPPSSSTPRHEPAGYHSAANMRDGTTTAEHQTAQASAQPAPLPDTLADSGAAPLLQLENAGIQRDGRWLVRNITLDLHRGEIVTLIGPNGSGKSTTAKMALGIYHPDEGQVKRSKALTIGYVPQKITIDPSLPLNVERLMRMTKALSNDEIQHGLAMAGITHLYHAPVAHLSGGEFQRVLLARAFACKPDLLVLDEPLQGVDFAGEAELYDTIARFRDQSGCAVLMISHDLHIVMAATDRVICLNGHICCSGTPVDVAASPEYARLFGLRTAHGTLPPASMAVYAHHHDHTHLADGRVQHADGTVTDHCHHQDGRHQDGHLQDEHHHSCAAPEPAPAPQPPSHNNRTDGHTNAE